MSKFMGQESVDAESSVPTYKQKVVMGSKASDGDRQRTMRLLFVGDGSGTALTKEI